MLRHEENIGLPAKFVLENGSFQMVGGTEKVNDSVFMLLAFMLGNRVYKQDYILPIAWAIQKPISEVIRLRTYIVGRVTKALKSYVKGVLDPQVALAYNPTDRKTLAITVDYTYALTEEDSGKVITYINV